MTSDYCTCFVDTLSFSKAKEHMFCTELYAKYNVFNVLRKVKAGYLAITLKLLVWTISQVIWL